MKDQDTVQQFIELRSQGVGFARIAAQLGVAKSTLILWSRQHQHLIHNLRTIEWEEFADRLLTSRKERLQALAEHLQRLEAELARRDLAEVSTPALQHLVEQVRRRLERECGDLQFTASVQVSRDDDSHETVQSWPA